MMECPMSLSKHVTKFVGLALLLAGAACDPRVVVFKPPVEVDPLPLAAEPSSTAQADRLVGEQWNLDKVGLDAAARRSLTGSKAITIAILSTGIDYNHEDLRGRVSVNEGEMKRAEPGSTIFTNNVDDDLNGLVDDIVGYDVVENDGFAFDRHGAGTAAAGIIAAQRDNGKGIAGIMSEVTLYPVRYINDQGQTNPFYLVRALEIASKAKPHLVYLQTTSIRLGGEEGTAEVAEVEIAAIRKQLGVLHAMGIPVVMGAGNDNTLFGLSRIDQVFRQFDNVVVVTASDSQDNKAFVANQSAQYVTTAAPGEDILTTKPNNSYGKVSSTACAAAHVVGAWGLVLAKNGSTPYSRVVQAILSENASDQPAGLLQASLGHNRLNVPKLVGAL
jgi:subtilisin